MTKLHRTGPSGKGVTLEVKLLLAVVVATAINTLLIMGAQAFLQEPWLGVLVGLAAALLVPVWLGRRLTKRFGQGTRAVSNGLTNLLDNDFSTTIAYDQRDELGEMVQLYNQLTEKLRRERQSIYQRELLLDMVIQNSSLCMVLTDATGRVVYSNLHARTLLNGGRPINGSALEDLLTNAPDMVASMVRGQRDGLFRVQDNGENELYHLSCARFSINTREHQLYLIKQMTKELHRQEAAVWKRVIRTISHELNNSLAPISSMAHSGGLMLAKKRYQELDQVFETIAERARHLQSFIEGYARIAKLPTPNKQWVEWEGFVQYVVAGNDGIQISELPNEPGFFDPSQLQQVLVNLLKNAAESGSNSNDIELHIAQSPQQSIITVLDRGSGMSGAVLENALLPFYTTKPAGSGIGLSLCREIVEAHDGEMSLANRNGNGLRVQICLPRAH